ncbi:cyclic nucleotide-binding domain-containing protein [Mesorhizobium sp. Root172]|jgi:CRP/FNR family transcriptional regulator, transcriptional activator FtrB|uniref:cyclic nucleotide-binding domain-containing protein n=1 Tax=Mesorhizobium sp. Root172 TaxID=1736481 RepID=UPI0006FF37EB|nr:cyclic nucleotide-binding domain-containing protein [Mesorhizobium sp. Root172]KRB30845.1 Crp/Fnr family transcriptional regulator [Mesorhizobium sp. Root172]
MQGMPDREVAPEALPLFRALSASKRTDLLRNAIVHGVASGTVLFEQGDVPNFQLIVLSGSAQLFGRSTEGREVLIEAVRPPDLIIPAAVVTGAPYLMQARVPEPSRFLLINAAVFRAAVETDPLLAHAVIGSLAQQFRRMVRQVKNLKLRSSTQRVGCYVLALSKRQGTPDRAVLPFEKTLIASELGITRESFSRALSKLGRSSIRVNGQTIAILDAPRLVAECNPDPLIDGADTDDLVV